MAAASGEATASAGSAGLVPSEDDGDATSLQVETRAREGQMASAGKEDIRL